MNTNYYNEIEAPELTDEEIEAYYLDALEQEALTLPPVTFDEFCLCEPDKMCPMCTREMMRARGTTLEAESYLEMMIRRAA